MPIASTAITAPFTTSLHPFSLLSLTSAWARVTRIIQSNQPYRHRKYSTLFFSAAMTLNDYISTSHGFSCHGGPPYLHLCALLTCVEIFAAYVPEVGGFQDSTDIRVLSYTRRPCFSCICREQYQRFIGSCYDYGLACTFPELLPPIM